MTNSVIIALALLLLSAYIFDITSSKTKIPAVILLLLLGWTVKYLVNWANISVPDLMPMLPILGTIGLILIVLEGSLELELTKEKIPLISKTIWIAFLSILFASLILAYCFYYFGNTNFKVALTNAIPFTVMSSAIAIPSVGNLTPFKKEFITYESSLSDIFGVIFFNFITLNEFITTQSVGVFVIDLLLMLIISFIATLGLAFLLSKITHHIKYIPIIMIILLIYTLSKTYHLPALIFILLFGLFMGNLGRINKHSLIQKLRPEILTVEAHKFRELTTEISFLIRTFFFLIFGYLIEQAELFNTQTILWAILIVVGMIGVRFLILKKFNVPLTPLVFVSPRGLITILLFLSIPLGQSNSMATQSLIIQVIILSIVIMMIGLMAHKKPLQNNEGI